MAAEGTVHLDSVSSQQQEVDGNDGIVTQMESSQQASCQCPEVSKLGGAGTSSAEPTSDGMQLDSSQSPAAVSISTEGQASNGSLELAEGTGEDSSLTSNCLPDRRALKAVQDEDTNGQASASRPDDTSTPTAASTIDSKADQSSRVLPTKNKKKEDKGIEYILRALSSLSTPEEKLAALCKKYADLHEEHRVLQSSFKQQQRRMSVLGREKDQLQAEHTKAVIAKSKLESLCRELQKHNKLIKEESVQRAREEEEKRREISAKFQTTIAEIQLQMTDNHEKNVKLREENADLAGKLKKFIEQHELREQQLEKLIKHRELEQQLADTKLQQAAIILKEEKERNMKEKELLLLQASEGHKKNSVLEAQLMMYKDRYEEFQATINKSNDMFQKLKNEMDKMGKRIKKLEKEGAQWRAKFEASNKALIDMAAEKKSADRERDVQQVKIQKLESLCRALQAELHGKSLSKSVPPPAEADTPESSPKENASLTVLTPDTSNGTSVADPDLPLAVSSEGSSVSIDTGSPVSSDPGNCNLPNSSPDSAEVDKLQTTASVSPNALVTDSADPNNAEEETASKDSCISACSSETPDSKGEALVVGALSQEVASAATEDIPVAPSAGTESVEQAAA